MNRAKCTDCHPKTESAALRYIHRVTIIASFVRSLSEVTPPEYFETSTFTIALLFCQYTIAENTLTESCSYRSQDPSHERPHDICRYVCI